MKDVDTREREMASSYRVCVQFPGDMDRPTADDDDDDDSVTVTVPPGPTLTSRLPAYGHSRRDSSRARPCVYNRLVHSPPIQTSISTTTETFRHLHRVPGVRR